MKRDLLNFALLLCVGVCLSHSAFGQSESHRLNSRLVEAFQKGDIDAAVPIAEEIVALERRATPASQRNLTNALENLGQVKLDRVKRSMVELRDTRLEADKARDLVQLLRKDASDAEQHFREALDLSVSGTTSEEQAVNLRAKLAWLNYNYIPAETNPTLGFDKDSRDKLELRQRAIYTRRFDEARRLYQEASGIVARSGNTTALLTANFNLAEFEVAMGNLEAAVPLFERIIVDAEKLLPPRSPELLAPYEAYLKVLVATSQEESAFDLLSKIVMISKKSAEYPKTLLNLTQRAERSFGPVNSLRVEEESKKIKSEQELAGRGIVARTAAAGGDAPAAALQQTVDGRQYYETAYSRGIRMLKVIVRIELNEDGKATLAEAFTTDKFLKETAETSVKEWTFRPLIVGGKPVKLKGYAEVSILTN